MAKLRMTFQVNRICPGAFDTAYSILYDNLFQVELADKAAAGLAKKKKVIPIVLSLWAQREV
jgi:hypothetical protein